jgi:cytochrome c biogenesis protein CcdA
MKFKPVQIFGFIMSFAYVFFGLLFVMTTFLENLIENLQYRKFFGIGLMAYGLFRVAFFLRQLRKKE